jgi:hypothetical protein
MPSISDFKIYGEEPTWNLKFTDEVDRSIAIGKALNWYNYMSDCKDHKKWLIEYLHKFNYSKEIIENISKIPADQTDVNSYDIPNCIGFKTGTIARMVTMGAPLNAQDVDMLERGISALNVRGANTAQQVANKPNVQKHIDDNFSKIVEYLEFKCDDILQSSSVADCITQNSLDRSIKSLARSGKSETFTNKEVGDYIAGVKSIYCKRIIDHYTPIYDEICNAISGKDQELMEAYSSYSRYTLNNVKQLMLQIINECKNRINTEPKPIIVRKRRRKPSTEIVKKLKYRKDDTEIGIVSILPSKIVESQKLVVYNSKLRTVTIYEAASSQGLSVKGTTIINYDEKKSRTKKLRKPKEFFAKVHNKGIRAFRSAFDAVRSVEKPAKGRINPDVVLYGVYE